jgi:hypothetical protein
MIKPILNLPLVNNFIETEQVEHFVTYFDNNFLPIGLCLYSSLLEHSRPFHLWILCLDELVEENLLRLSLPHTTLIPLREAEDDRLLTVKPTRSRGEYCWTLTPFTPQFVFDRNNQVSRVTYLDADLFFFDSPKIFLDEFELSGKHVLITEHGYDPKYDRTEKSGRFCVQFMTFRRTEQGFGVMRWWQDRCIEWCFDRIEDGKFGDQKYLDQWPTLFPSEVHILSHIDKTLAPWNVDYFLSKSSSNSMPVFYHFQSFRIVSEKIARLYVGVKLSENVRVFYDLYLISVRLQIAFMKKHGIPFCIMPEPSRKFNFLRKIFMRITGNVGYASLSD